MEAFKSLWRPRGSIAIPEYGPLDGVDLQVKSLVYMYKRLDIPHTIDKLAPQPLDGVPDDDIVQLDKLYNIKQFERVVLNDPHHVLIDWPKNRFRAMLILPHMPQMEQLPSFREPHFHFAVLEADASQDEYVRTLTTSDIYVEHHLPAEIKREIAATVVRKYRQPTLEARAQIVLEYLQLVATEIQVARIYKAMLAKMSPHASPSASPSASPIASPQHSPHLSPQRSPHLSPQHSPHLPPHQSPHGSPHQSSQIPVHARSPSPPRLSVRTPVSLRQASPGSAEPPAQKGSRSPSPVRSSPSRFPRAGTPSTAAKMQSATPKLRPGPGATVHASHGSSSPSPPGSPTLAAHSPPQRLKLKTSSANLKLDAAPNLTQQQPVGPSVDAGKKHILHQARLAVQARIEKERQAMMKRDEETL